MKYVFLLTALLAFPAVAEEIPASKAKMNKDVQDCLTKVEKSLLGANQQDVADQFQQKFNECITQKGYQINNQNQ